MKNPQHTATDCAHCRQPIKEAVYSDDGSKIYCCYGCKVVDALLNNDSEIIGKSGLDLQKYAYLDESGIRKTIIDFEDRGYATARIHMPQIHCSSCIYLLENLPDVEKDILDVQVQFSRKEARISFRSDKLPLSQLAALLDYIGYPPDFQTKIGTDRKPHQRVLMQLGVAGFFFGNTMLLALPEYLHGSLTDDAELQRFFRYLMMLFSIPVIVFSGRDYFINAFKSLRAGVFSIDLPIALGISVLFLRSAYEVFSGMGSGYFDSLTGLIFFLLIGKWYQQKTYQNFTFDRDFRSFIPLAANLVLKSGKEKPISVDELTRGDSIIVRQGEILPADARLMSAGAQVDYSYITGESIPVQKNAGDTVFAGARIVGNAAHLEVLTTVDHSYLSSLWSKDVFNVNDRKSTIGFTDKVSQYFTPIIILIAISAALFWSATDISKSVTVFTAVLIVACPCALALAEPFASGSMMRWFGNYGFYLKNSAVLNRLAQIDHIIFDKTGTLTEQNSIKVQWHGSKLSEDEKRSVASVAMNTQHPLARPLLSFLNISRSESHEAVNFVEATGEGVTAEVSGHYYRVGKASFIGVTKDAAETTSIYLENDGKLKGYFSFFQETRENVAEIISGLGKNYKISLLSGDNEAEKVRFGRLFGSTANLHFNQSPHEKLEVLNHLQHNGEKVLMIGDGLNDAGALQQSEVGISLCEKNINFFPASDALLLADSFQNLGNFISLSDRNQKVIHYAFLLSFIYNIGGLSFAVMGVLSPLICAILMPVSSVSVVIFTTLANRYYCKRQLGKTNRAIP